MEDPTIPTLAPSAGELAAHDPLATLAQTAPSITALSIIGAEQLNVTVPPPILDAMAVTTAQPLAVAQQVSADDGWKRQIGSRTGNYKCARCGQPKKNHTCSLPAQEKPAREVKNHGWRRREDVIIQEGVLEHGFRWSTIAESLPGRTDNAVRNRWHRMERARKFREELPMDPNDPDGQQAIAVTAETLPLASAPGAEPAADGGVGGMAMPLEMMGASVSGAGALIIAPGAGGAAAVQAVASSRAAAGGGGKGAGYRCSKCNQPKKGHLCPAMNDAPLPAELGGALGAAGLGAAGLGVAVPPDAEPPAMAPPEDLDAAAAAAGAAAAAAATAAAAKQLGQPEGEMVVVGNRVVSASEGAAVDYLATFGIPDPKRERAGAPAAK